MDSVRYFVAVVTLVGVPPGLLLWFVIHPFAPAWRRLGPRWTYAVLTPFVIALMFALFQWRGVLLSTDFGTSYVLAALGIVCVAAAAMIKSRRSKQLTSRILMGIPELSTRPEDQRLLTEGIYARIRHPRYIEALLWTLGYAFFANYLGTYVVVTLSFLAVYLIVLLEERELRARFGTAYVEYCSRVPRFLPRRSREG